MKKDCNNCAILSRDQTCPIQRRGYECENWTPKDCATCAVTDGPFRTCEAYSPEQYDHCPWWRRKKFDKGDKK